MAQHDYNIANQSGADFRADLNNALLAIATVNSGSTEPSTTFAHQLWVDTSSSVLKIRNAADNAWITTGVSITASNTFTGDLTGNVTGNLTGNVTGNVTGDLTGNADSADTLSTARTISLSGDVVGSVSFDGSANVDIDTVVQINSITLGTDTTGDYVESMSGGTGVTVTGGTGEGSTPSIAIGQAVATTDDVTFNIITASEEFIGDLEGGIRFNAKADGALSKGDVVYISGVSGDVPTVAQAKADDASKMPAFGLALSDANDNAALQVVTFGTIEELDTSGVSEGQILYVSTTAGAYTTTAPTGESSQIQNIGKVIRSHAAAGSIKVGGAGRSNATPNLDNGKIFIGNGSNQATTSTLDTSIVVENTNLYYTTARANTDFDTRLATKDTDDLTEGGNLYYTTARVNSDFDTRLATKDTGDLTEGVNLYYTDARVNSAFDTRLATKDTDDLSEGTTNLYYTSGRANTDFDTRLGTKSTSDLAEGTNLYYTSARFDSAFTSKDTDDLSEGTTNLYYTSARFDSAFGNKTTADLTENTNLYYTDTRANSAIDARVTKAFVDALGIQASSVDANSVTLGTDTVGNYVATITGTANKITVSGSGSESADVTLSLPDDVQIADSLTVAGNLTVNGTLTSLDTTNLDIEDNLFQLNAGLTGSPVNDSGMLINRGTSDNSIFMWDESVDKFTMGLTTADGSATGNITLNSLGTLVVNVEGNLTGNVTGTVSSLSNHDTADLTEGTNLYYTQARFDSAFTAKSTTDLSEGSNLYYTDARFDTRLATKDTDDVSEGTSNLYYTSARFNSAFSGKSTSDLSEGSNLYYTDARVQAVSINNVVEDTTPQLGGDLDLNSNDITGTGDINITGTIQSSGNITGTLATAAQPNITSVGTLTGIDVTGTATMDGLTVDGNTTLNTSSTLFANLNYSGSNLGKLSTDGVNLNVEATSNLFLKVNSATRAKFDGNGDISFYEDTGSTAKLFWDASAESLGIGTTSLTTSDGSNVELSAATSSRVILASTGTGGRKWTMATGTAGSLDFYDYDASAYRMRIDGSTGNVGIGTDSPAAGLQVAKGSSTIPAAGASTSSACFGNDNSDDNYGVVVGAGGNGVGYISSQRTDGTATTYNLSIQPNGGNVGIGTDSPAAPLDIKLNTNSTADIFKFQRLDGAVAGVLNYSGTDGAISFGTTTSHDLTFDTANTERLRIDTSGNTSITASGNPTLTVKGSDGAYSPFLVLQAAGGGGSIINATGATSNSLSVQIAGSEKLRIDSSGSLVLQDGTTYTSNAPTHRGSLILAGASGATSYGGIEFHPNAGGGAGYGSKIGASDAEMTFSTRSNSATFTQRMVIKGDGQLLFGKTSTSDTDAGLKIYEFGGMVQGVDGTGNVDMHDFFRGTAGSLQRVGNIRTNGSSTAYNTSSDYRLKENVDYTFNALDRVAQLKPARFNFIADADNTVDGFLAHEVQNIVPEAVAGEKDAMMDEEYEITPAVLDDDGNVVTEAEMGTREVPEYQGIDQSKLVPLLTKAIQEQQELINNLTSRIEELEN